MARARVPDEDAAAALARAPRQAEPAHGERRRDAPRADERGDPTRRARRGAGRGGVRAVTFAWPLFLLALLAVPARARLRALAGPAPRALPGRVHEPRRARVGRRASGGRGAGGCRSCSSCSRSRSASAAVARPRAETWVPEENATVVLLVDTSGLDARRRRRADAPRRGRLGDARVPRRPPGALQGRPRRVQLGAGGASPSRRATGRRCATRSAISRPRPAPRSATGSNLDPPRPGDAHARRRAARRERELPAAIVLLSDGAQNRGPLQPLEAARNARAAGISVYTVALGTPKGVVTFGFGLFGELDPGAARPADDARDRADDGRQELHREDGSSELRTSTASSARASAGAASCARSPRGSSPPPRSCSSPRSPPGRAVAPRVGS